MQADFGANINNVEPAREARRESQTPFEAGIAALRLGKVI